MFWAVGNMQQYLKNQKMQFQAFSLGGLQTGSEKARSAGLFSSGASGEEDEEQARKLERIKSKLRQGIRLTASEMAYLREHASDLYRKAKYIESQRQQLNARLERCKTKEEVSSVVNGMRSAAGAACGLAPGLADSTGGDGMEFSQWLTNAIADEYNRHGRPCYAALPSEKDRQEKKQRQSGRYIERACCKMLRILQQALGKPLFGFTEAKFCPLSAGKTALFLVSANRKLILQAGHFFA